MATNITVKKADGTTDVVYTNVTGATGRDAAVYRNNTVGTTPAEKPEFSISNTTNGPKTAIRMPFSFAWPTVTEDAGGNKSISGRASLSGSLLIPSNMPDADIAELVAQSTNLLVSAAIRASFNAGIAPR